VPILAKETDIYPPNLLDLELGQPGLPASSAPDILAPDLSVSTQPGVDPGDAEADQRWWSLYTRSRQEKSLMRQLLEKQIAFYSPLVERRYRAPNGRIRTSYLPLFTNYVFLRGTEEDRYTALTTNCVSQCSEVNNGLLLVRDLRTVARLISVGRALTPETKLRAGDRVRIKSGAFAGFEGVILRRQRQVRLLVAVEFIQQGVSVELDDCQFEKL
jgi:transcription antitermination factor NusG